MWFTINSLNTERSVFFVQKTNPLQEALLSSLQRGKQSVTVFLMNGFQLRGQITGYDAFIVVLTTEAKQQIIYKHAISTIIPEKPVPIEQAPIL